MQAVLCNTSMKTWERSSHPQDVLRGIDVCVCDCHKIRGDLSLVNHLQVPSRSGRGSAWHRLGETADLVHGITNASYTTFIEDAFDTVVALVTVISPSGLFATHLHELPMHSLVQGLSAPDR